jgi:hypothetical protein
MIVSGSMFSGTRAVMFGTVPELGLGVTLAVSAAVDGADELLHRLRLPGSRGRHHGPFGIKGFN